MLLRIAWRNIWRNRQRSLTIIGAVAIGIWAALFLLSFSDGMSRQRISDAVENEVGHFQVHNVRFEEADRDIHYSLAHGTDLVHELQRDPQVQVATSRLIVMAMAQSALSGSSIELDGIEPSEETLASHLDSKICDGSYFKGDEHNAIITSSRLAEKMSLKLKSKVILSFQGPNNDILSAAFRIVGLYKTSNSQYDKMHVFARRDDVQRLVGDSTIIDEIAVKLKNIAELDAFVSRYRDNHPDLQTQRWEDLAPDLHLVNDAFDQSMQIFSAIIMLALAFGIVNTMLMAVLERVKELGMLMAVGMNKRRVFSMILLETMLLSLCGVPIGVLFTWATVTWFGTHGIDLSIVGQGLESLGYGSMVYPHINPGAYVDSIVQVVAVAMLSSLYPARKALQLKPVEAIRTL